MKTFDLYTPFGTYEKCFFQLDQYAADNSLAIEIYNYEDGPIARLTVYVETSPQKNCAYIDINNCNWAEMFIREHDFGKPTGNIEQSGFCIYPEYEFNLDKIMEYTHN